MSKKRTRKNLRLTGGALILLGPLVFAFSLPISGHLCSTGVLECGYANLGATGYSLYFGLVPLVIGVIVFFTGLILEFKKHK